MERRHLSRMGADSAETAADEPRKAQCANAFVVQSAAVSAFIRTIRD